jgi:hypothetical protein
MGISKPLLYDAIKLLELKNLPFFKCSLVDADGNSYLDMYIYTKIFLMFATQIQGLC